MPARPRGRRSNVEKHFSERAALPLAVPARALHPNAGMAANPITARPTVAVRGGIAHSSLPALVGLLAQFVP